MRAPGRHKPLMEGERVCRTCEQSKPVRDYAPDPYASGGRAWVCRPCLSAGTRSWYAANREKSIARQVERNRFKRMGITPEQYNALMEEQEGRCANVTCKTPQPYSKGLSADHNHVTGAIRALLCGPCNSALGLARDDEQVLLGLVHYLREHARADLDHHE